MQSPVPDTQSIQSRLTAVLQSMPPLAIAVSGGIDSLTLAVAAHRQVQGTVMFHALSQAVPVEATARVRQFAAQEGWTLHMLDAGEQRDGRYRANPVNRCYYCKHNLYQSIASFTAQTIASGTNLDDLGDFRPGLQAAAEQGVVHPFVEARISKADIRRLAAGLGLGDIQHLPASPCLASRITTGIPIEADLLGLLDRIESDIKHQVLQSAGPVNLRCRVLADGLSIQSDEPLVSRQDDVTALIRSIMQTSRFQHLANNIRFGPYVQGSAFIQQV